MASEGREIRGFQDLVVWRRAMDLVIEAYGVTKSFPVEERYGLTAQLRRAAISVPSNIAEGRGRFGLGSFLYHLSVASGSLMELETQILIAARLGYLKPEQARTLLDTLGEVRRLLAAMVRALRRERAPDSR
ncbi:MAG TPA: four helix bundle protein [Gemmatimonadales bacterium]|nr:four helix bundle protein [Gemmatimonadales bacterium]